MPAVFSFPAGGFRQPCGLPGKKAGYAGARIAGCCIAFVVPSMRCSANRDGDVLSGFSLRLFRCVYFPAF
ncbi:hypothetical protein BSIN_3524 [Burkholderia singularis]|uniref:Uncharacterized protein n=1 Tax=Burkholderia singularis TaxID=1503053 RepID=A0A238H5M7_9BURK|nr:hypothetical protein BSIN_3524 [Burkholderia singularis]